MIKIDKLVLKFNYRDAIVAVLLAVLTIAILSRAHTDPDLGWHLRNGMDILKYGVPSGDLYSHTMSGYPWIAHEWLTDVLIYLSAHYLGFTFLAALFGAIVFLAYFIAAKTIKMALSSSLMIVLIAALVAMPVVGIRPQMLTLLGLAIVLRILFKWRDNPASRLIFWLVPLMLIWVNLHGGFAAGIFLIGLFWIVESSKYLLKKFKFIAESFTVLSIKHLTQLAFTGVLAIAVTLINPYTYRVYVELFQTVFNDFVKSNIAEWAPVNTGTYQGYNLMIYALFIVLLLIFSWKQVDKTKVVIAAVFLGISLSSWRHLPLFSLVTLPLLAEMVQQLMPKGVIYYLRSNLFMLGLLLLTATTTFYAYAQISSLANDDKLFGQVGKYPYGAVQYLKAHKLPGNMFNEYNWGGYLIWQLPEKRVSIDGRMAIWKTSEQNIFEEYLLFSRDSKKAKEILDKYKIGLALVYKDRTFKDYFFANSNEWQLAYSDELAVIFTKKNLD